MSLKSIEISRNPVMAWETYHLSLYPKKSGSAAHFYDLDRERLADGVYGRLRFSFSGSRSDLEEFFENGLGRDIKIYNENGMIDYEGFILSLTLDTGVHVLRKSLEHIFNKVWARYDATGGVSPTQRSTVYQNATSQARFGIIEKILGGGQQAGASQINQAVQNKLALFAWPMIDPDLYAGSTPHIEVLAVGYQHTLGWRAYNQTVLTGNAGISVVLDAVISACGQFISSSQITSNTMLVPRVYDSDRFALDVVTSLAAMGDTLGNRYLVRVDAGRIFKYVPSEQ